MGKTFLALVIKEDLEDVERMEIQIPRRWRTAMNSGSLVIGGKIDILAGGPGGQVQGHEIVYIQLYQQGHDLWMSREGRSSKSRISEEVRLLHGNQDQPVKVDQKG